ncbi:MAG: molybdenum cofactor biosynthesis protein MoaE [Planctomycetota bacterium]
MELEIRLFAGLRERAGKETILLSDLPEELTLADLKSTLADRHPELGPLDHIAGVVGTRYVSGEEIVRAGDQVALLPPVSGGAPSADELLEHGVFELSADALDPAECARRVAHPSCGAVTTFAGEARDHHRGRRVLKLEYEAFAEMTAPEMERIFQRCLESCVPAAGETGEATDAHGSPRLLRMLVAHRIGTCDIGQPAVVIAVASPHRDAAFRACRFLIDELKKTLPVWKKEFYEDGSHWIGDRS